MIYLAKTKFIILIATAILLIAACYFYYFQKPAGEPQPIETKTGSLADDENYIKKRVDDLLSGNPSATEEYAQDIIYEEIAFNEQNVSICKKIKIEEVKNHCHRLFSISK